MQTTTFMKAMLIHARMLFEVLTKCKYKLFEKLCSFLEKYLFIG